MATDTYIYIYMHMHTFMDNVGTARIQEPEGRVTAYAYAVNEQWHMPFAGRLCGDQKTAKIPRRLCGVLGHGPGETVIVVCVMKNVHKIPQSMIRNTEQRI